jgi:hypothetical protein
MFIGYCIVKSFGVDKLKLKVEVEKTSRVLRFYEKNMNIRVEDIKYKLGEFKFVDNFKI